MYNTSDDVNETEYRHKLVTVEAILYLMRNGGEWKPLTKHSNTPQEEGSQYPLSNSSRETIVNIIRSRNDEDYAMNLLHDERFISHDSRFCHSQDISSHEQRPGRKKINTENIKGILPDTLDHMTKKQLKELWENFDKFDVLEFNEHDRNIGDIQKLCPCTYYNTDETFVYNGEKCAIDAVICSLRFAYDDSELYDLFDTCQEDSVYIVYDIKWVETIREILQDHGVYLSEQGLQCHNMMPSNLWGIATKNNNNLIDGLDLLINAKSGVSLSNLIHVNSTFSTNFGEINRTVVFKTDNTTTAHNLLCRENHENEPLVASIGFPVLSMLAESPAVINCLRYILEITWADILDQYDPLTANSNFETIDLHTRANSTVVLWEARCRAKLIKLRRCSEQGAYNSDVIRRNNVVDVNIQDKCPYVLSDVIDTNMHKIAILYVQCIVIYNNKWYDPRLCVPHEDGEPAKTLRIALSDLRDNCEVFNPLDMLTVPGKYGITALPELRHDFVNDIVGVDALGARTAGLVGIKIGTDFLFPKHNSGAQCFDSYPYWPQTWQAPFGEILDDNYHYLSAFSSYMALVKDCDTCKEEVVILPNKLREIGFTSTKFGTSGFCRENSFGMPMVHTNSHRLCSSQVEYAESDSAFSIAGDDVLDSFACSTDVYHNSGGGMGSIFGELSGFLKRFVDIHKEDYTTFDDFFIPGTTTSAPPIYSSYITDFDTDIELSEYDHDNMYNTIRDICSTENNYGIIGQRDVECTKNDECGTGNKICNVEGRCAEIDIYLQNEAAVPVEVGISGIGCRADSSVSGASPWGRLPGFLHQHGFCSHSNTITYDRWLSILNKCSTTPDHADCKRINCMQETVDGLKKYVCKKNETTWDWVRQVPDFWPIDPGSNTNIKDENIFTMLSEVVGDVWGVRTNTTPFALHPHICDSEYMHASNFGWCQLSGDSHDESSWMRTSATSDQFTVYDNEKGHGKFKRNKLRFMGLLNDSFIENPEQVLVSAIQQCSTYGVCQEEHFTFGGVTVQRRKIQHETLDEVVIRPAEDMIKCGPFGNFLQTLDECVLDPMVARFHINVLRGGWCSHLIADVLKEQLTTLISNYNYSNLIAYAQCEIDEIEEKGTVHRERQCLRNQVYFHYKTKNTVKVGKVWNNMLILVGSLTNSYINNKESMAHHIHQCAEHMSDTTSAILYDKKLTDKSSGMYFMLSAYGSYEIPIFWWLKYAISRRVYKNSDAFLFDNTQLIPRSEYKFAAYEHRKTYNKNSKTPNNNPSIEKTLAEVWARTNTKTVPSIGQLSENLATVFMNHFQEQHIDKTHIHLTCAREMQIRSPPQLEDDAFSACTEENIYEIFMNNQNVSLWTTLPGSCQDMGVINVLDEYEKHGKKLVATDPDKTNLLFAHPDKIGEPIETEAGVNSIFSPYNSLRPQETVHIADKIIKLILENHVHTLPLDDSFSASVRAIIDSGDGIPVAELDLAEMQEYIKGNDINVDEITENVLKNFQENQVEENKNPELHVVDIYYTPPVIYKMFGDSFESRLSQAKMTGWHYNTQSKPEVVIYAGGVQIRTIDMCAEDLYTSETSSTPQYNDGMSCSLYDLQNTHATNGERCRDISHNCDTATTNTVGDSIDVRTFRGANPNGRTNTRCLFGGNEDHPLDNDTPKLYKNSRNENIYLSALYTHNRIVEPSQHERKRGSICHRVDSPCVTQKNPANIEKIFGENIRRAVDVGYSRFQGDFSRNFDGNRNIPYTDLNMDYEDLRDTKNPMILDDPGETCNVDSIEYSDIFDVDVFTLNRRDFTKTKPTFAHVMYNDRVLMTRHNEQQLLFGHYTEDGGISTASPAPAWSFCPTGGGQWGILHYFREVEYNNGTEKYAESFVSGNYNKFDQKFNMRFDVRSDFGEDYMDFTVVDSTAASIIKKYLYSPLQWGYSDELAKVHQKFAGKTPGNFPGGSNYLKGSCATIPTPLGNTVAWDLFELGMCYEQDVYEAINDNPWWSMSICDTICKFLDKSISYLFLNLGLGVRVGNFRMADFFMRYEKEMSLYDYDNFYLYGSDAWPKYYKEDQKDKDIKKRFHDYIKEGKKTKENLWPSDANGWGYTDLTSVLARIFYGNFRKDIQNSRNGFGTGTFLSDNQHDLTLAPCLQYSDDGVWQAPGTTYDRDSCITRVEARWKIGTCDAVPITPIIDADKTFIEHIDRNGHCRHGGSKLHFITKPTQWELIERHPDKHHLVPCSPKCQGSKEPHCLGCYPILINNTNGHTHDTDTNKIKWEASGSGACSYSVKYKKKNSFCWDSDLGTDFDDMVDSYYIPDNHVFLPRFGTKHGFYRRNVGYLRLR